MRQYVVVMLFSNDKNKILMVKRNKPPYQKCWNGVGGKIEQGETKIEAAIRETKEETNIDLISPKLHVTYIYPEGDWDNSGIELSVLYDFVNEVQVDSNYEGIYEWKDIDFAMDFNNKEIAGFANVSQMIKEILDSENIQKFYK